MPNLMSLERSVLLLMANLLILHSGWGQACSSSSAPIATNLDFFAEDARLLEFQLGYHFNRLQDVLTGREELNDERRRRTSRSLLFRTSYTFAPRWSGSVLFSYVEQQERNEGLTGTFSETRARGLGDAAVMAQYELLQWRRSRLYAGLGVTIPFGDYRVVNDLTGLLLSPDHQPGSGAWDVLSSLQYQGNNIIGSKIDVFSAFSFRRTSTFTRFDGRQKYRFGNRWQNITGVSAEVSLDKVILIPYLQLQVLYAERDLVDSIRAPATGGFWSYFLPQVAIRVSALTLSLSGQLPAWRSLNETQLTTSYSFAVRMAYILGR